MNLSFPVIVVGGASAPAGQFLVQQYGAPALLLATTKENSAYSGNFALVSTSSGGNQTAIPFSGKNINSTIADGLIASNTNFGDVYYDQSGNGNDATQTTLARRARLIKDSDGQYSWHTTTTAQGWDLPDTVSLRIGTPEIYWIVADQNLDAPDERVSFAYGASGSAENARYSYICSYDQQFTIFARNGSPSNYDYGQALWCGDAPPASGPGVGSFYIMNFRPATQDLRGGTGFQVIPASASTTITYTGTIKLTIGNNFGYTSGSATQRWRAFIVYNTTVSNTNRNAISNYLMSSASQNLAQIPWTYTSSDGYAFSGFYRIGLNVDDPDAFGNVWNVEGGAHLYNQYQCTNLSNPSSNTMVRFEVRPGEHDTTVTGNERYELNLLSNNNPVWTRPGPMSQAWLIYFETSTPTPLDIPAGGWDYNSQCHTGAGAQPSNFSWTCARTPPPPDGLGGSLDEIRAVTQNGADTVVRGSGFSFTRGVWYQAVVHAQWSSNGVNDHLEMWVGRQDSPPLTKICDVTANSMFWEAPATDANVKRGSYNNLMNAPMAYRMANWQWSTAANAYSSLVSAPMSVPGHT